MQRDYWQMIKNLLMSLLFRPVDLGRLCARSQPSARDSFPLVTCGILQRRTKGRPSGRLHSDAQVSQQETPKTLHLPIGAPWRVLWRWLSELWLVYTFSFWQRSFLSPLCVTSRLEQATREFLENLPKVPTPFPTFKALFKLLPHSKRLKAHLIIKRSAFKMFKTLGSIYSTLKTRNGNCIK